MKKGEGVSASGSAKDDPTTNTSTSAQLSPHSVCPPTSSTRWDIASPSPCRTLSNQPLKEEEGNGDGIESPPRQLSLAAPQGRAAASGRSGSAGTIEAPDFATSSVRDREGHRGGKRASFHHHPHAAHGKKLIRTASFLTDSSYTPSAHMNVFPKPIEPIPQPVVTQTRRCSLTLPYPNLYGSWQAAAAAAAAGPAGVFVGESSAPRKVPPPLLKRRSVALLYASRQAGEAPTPSFIEPLTQKEKDNLKKALGQSPDRKQLPDSSTSTSVARLLSSPDEEPPGHGGEEIEDEVVIELDEALDEPYLLSVQLQKVPMKDFGSEVRAPLDVAHFLNQAVLLLDVVEPSLEGVVEMMLNKLFINADEPHCSVAEVKSALFAHDSVHLLARTIQGTTGSEGVSFDYDQSWICAICNLPSLQRRHVAITRLKHPANFGRTSHEVRLFILVLCPSKEKGTKNALETGRTFATILSDMEFRQTLLEAHTEEEFKRVILRQAQLLSQLHKPDNNMVMANHTEEPAPQAKKRCWFQCARGIREDFRRRFLSTIAYEGGRISVYLSDYLDGVVGYKSIQKTISSTFFLYFACILPAIAFGVLNDHTTGGIIDVKKVIVGQTMGELFFVILGGQPLNVLLTTAPLCLFVKVVYALSEDFGVDFPALYLCVGLWSSLFTMLYALFDVSRLMRWSTRSTEEIFALFISIAFFVDALRDTLKNFSENYNTAACAVERNVSGLINSVVNDSEASETLHLINTGNAFWTSDNKSTVEALASCHREGSLLFLLLMLGTLWVGVSLYNFNKTPYLQASKREALADYSLPVAVILLSFIGSYVFGDVELERFKYDDKDVFTMADMSNISWKAMLCSVGLGFSLSLLIFMDQNITSAMVNNPCNKLKKGPAYHWDLLVVAFVNAFLSIFTLPWMHSILPHAPLHVRSLADVEERVDQGHVYEIIVRVRETRLTGIFSHVLIGLSLFLLPYPLGYIPIAVLDGLFLYMAVTALNGNQMFERITLLFMEQAAYPPNHYIRRVPQRKIHQFTGCQVLQLCVMCTVGFVPFPYVKMAFPVTILLLLPIRHLLVPHLIEPKFLEALDGEHQ